MGIYNGLKIGLYSIGIIVTLVAIVMFGLDGSHTPPFGFVIPLLMGCLGVLWLIIDWAIGLSSRKVMMNYKIHGYGILINFLILLFIILSTIN